MSSLTASRQSATAPVARRRAAAAAAAAERMWCGTGASTVWCKRGKADGDQSR